jgi:acyl transferase domain-containing protein
MLAIGLPKSQVEHQIGDMDARRKGFGITLACINSPTSVTVSGEERLIDFLKENFNKQRVFARKLGVSVAYYSCQMEIFSNTYASTIGELHSSDNEKTPMISSVTGETVQTRLLLDASYWISNMVSEVQFDTAVTTMFAQSCNRHAKMLGRSHLVSSVVDYLIEIGPHSPLQGPAGDILQPFKGEDPLDTTHY